MDRKKKIEAAQQHYEVGKDLSWNKGEYDAALSELNKSLSIRQSLYGFEHEDTSKSYYEIGRVLFAQKKYTDCFVAYRKCLKIRVSLLGKFHMETKNADHCLRLVVQAKGLHTAQEINEAVDAVYSSMNHEISGDNFRKAGRNAEAQLEYIKAVANEEFFFGKKGDIILELNRKAGIKAPPPPRK